MEIDRNIPLPPCDKIRRQPESVQSWLDCVPQSPPPRPAASLAFTQPSRARKRSEAEARPTRARAKKRRTPLGTVSVNIMQDQTHSTGKRHATAQAATGRRGRRRATEDNDADSHSCVSTTIGRQDPEQTPRAKIISYTTPSLPPSLSQSKTSSARSRSPVKMAEMDAIAGGCQHQRLDSSDEIGIDHPLVDIKRLVERIEDAWQGQGVIPARFRDTLVQKYPRQFRYSHYFDETNGRDSLGQSIPPEELPRFEDPIRHCIENQVSEAGWNHKYHYPMLERSVGLSQHSEHLDVAVL